MSHRQSRQPNRRARAFSASGRRQRAGAIQPHYSRRAIKDLLRDAYTVQDLRRIFIYSDNPKLHELVDHLGPNDDLMTMIDDVVELGRKRDLLPDLLAEVERERHAQYAKYRSRLLIVEGRRRHYIHFDLVVGFVAAALGLGVLFGVVIMFLLGSGTQRSPGTNDDGMIVPTCVPGMQVPVSESEPVGLGVSATIITPREGTPVQAKVYVPVQGTISGLQDEQRAFLCLQPIKNDGSFAKIYPQGEIQIDQGATWQVKSIYETPGFRYRTFVVITSNPASAAELADDYSRVKGMDSLPANTESVGQVIVVPVQ